MEEVEQNNIQFEFHKENDKNKFWRVRRIGEIRWGEHLFSIDKKKIYNLFADYPKNFTREEKEIFDKEYPYWKKFFKGRDQRTIEDYENE